MVLVAVGGEALQVLLEEEELVEGGVAELDGDEPRQNDDKEERQTG